MKSNRVCPKCGSTRISGPHGLTSSGGIVNSQLRIILNKAPAATLTAYACANCGYTEIYSDNLGLDNIRKHGRFLHSPSELQKMRKSCPICGRPVRLGLTTCPECGYDLTQ